MKILLIEDDTRTAGFIRDGLQEEGAMVHHAADGKSGLDIAIEETFDAAIVDIMLPELDGLSLVEQLRSSGSTMPVLFLSGRKNVEDRLSGFKAGGDDYLVKPFSFAELVARLHAIRFYHGDASRSISGSGLGLALVKALAGKHNGSVSVDSNGQSGSCFIVTIPRRTF